MLDFDPAAWKDSLPGENDLWFNRFRSYLLMPKQSLLGCFHQENVKEGKKKLCKVPPGSWIKAFKRFEWAQRTRAFDNHRYAEREAEFKKWDYEFREMQRRAAIDNFAIADRMSKYPLDTQSLSEDGRTIIINPAKWSMRDIATLRMSGAELGQRAVRRPDVDLLQAVEILVAEGILPAEILSEGDQGYDEMHDRLRSVINFCD